MLNIGIFETILLMLYAQTIKYLIVRFNNHPKVVTRVIILPGCDIKMEEMHLAPVGKPLAKFFSNIFPFNFVEFANKLSPIQDIAS